MHGVSACDCRAIVAEVANRRRVGEQEGGVGRRVVGHEAPSPQAGVGPRGTFAPLRRDVARLAEADVGERGHLVDCAVAEVVAEFVRDDRGVAGAGRLIAAAEVLRAEHFDFAGFEAELLAGSGNGPEGKGAVVVSAVTEGDFSKADGQDDIHAGPERVGLGKGVTTRRLGRSAGGVVILPHRRGEGPR